MGRIYPFRSRGGNETPFIRVPNEKPPSGFEPLTPSLRVSSSEMDKAPDEGLSPTTVYRFYGDDDDLLYVGITGSGLRRMSQHRRTSAFWGDARRIELEHYHLRDSALDREKSLIQEHKPPFNTTHNPDRLRPTDEEVKPEIPETYVSIEQIAELYRVSVDAVKRDYADGRLGPPAGYVEDVPVWDEFALERRLVDATRAELKGAERGVYPPRTQDPEEVA